MATEEIPAELDKDAFDGEVQEMFGHPKGLFYLFFAEFWERFSFYGMRALLVLYMTKELFFKEGAEKETKIFAFSIFAAYGALVYATPFIGGIIADKLLGYRKSIVIGGILMAIGHFVLAIENELAFYSALAFIIVGNGFFKPNISSFVGTLYKQGDTRRDAGFTIFYMGINFGALTAPLLCGWLGEEVGWHWGFGAAGVGMVLGLIFFWDGMRKNVFGNQGYPPAGKGTASNTMEAIVYVLAFVSVPVFTYLIQNEEYVSYILFTALGISIVYICYMIFIASNLPPKKASTLVLIGAGVALLATICLFFSAYAAYIIFGVLGTISLIYVAYILITVSSIEAQRIVVVCILTFFITVFWAFFEQSGSSLTLFAEENVNLMLINASQTNSINPTFIVIFAIPFSIMWVALSKKNLNPNTPVKFALGIAQLGIGFLIFAVSIRFADANALVPMIFLILGYMLLTTGELFISPVGLSKVTELTPKQFVGFMMGVWFLSSSFAHYIAGIIAALTASDGSASEEVMVEPNFIDNLVSMVTGVTAEQASSFGEGMQKLYTYSTVFAQVGFAAIGFAIFAILLSPFMKKWMHGIK